MAQRVLQPFLLDEYPNLLETLTEHVMKPGYGSSRRGDRRRTLRP
jgi:hypothetical protein